MYAEVIVDISHEAIDKSFSYRIPKDMELHVGDPVLVPFGREKKRAYVIKMSDTSEYPEDKIRDIISPLKKEFSLENTLLDLAIWMSREYGCTLNQCLKTVLPVKKKIKKRGKTGELLLKRETAPVELNKEQKRVLQGIRNSFSKGGTFRRDGIGKDRGLFTAYGGLYSGRKGSDFLDSGNILKLSDPFPYRTALSRHALRSSFQDEPGRTSGKHGEMSFRRSEDSYGASFCPVCTVFQSWSHYYG